MPAITHKHGLGAHEAEVVQRLDNRYFQLPGNAVQRWRDQRKGIVRMNQVGCELLMHAPQFTHGLTRPKRRCRSVQRRHVLDVGVVPAV